MENEAMVITSSTASLCGRFLSDARQIPNIRSIAGSLLSQYANQDVKSTSIRVAGIAQFVLRHNSNLTVTQLAKLAIARA